LNSKSTIELITINEASKWATDYLGKNVTPSNISYLIQYGRVKKFSDNGNTLINKKELFEYYNSYNGKREINWKEQLGTDLNWILSFEQYKEAETTKHVHRLHPYKGKFIPQLVEYFIDEHTDKLKKEVFFHKGDIILDPFCGSGTTLVQANELGLHAVGIDISAFNSLISNCKILKYDINDLQKEINRITDSLKKFLSKSHTIEFEEKLLKELYKFNSKYFPSPEFKYRVKKGFNGDEYGYKKVKEFQPIYDKLIKEYNINLHLSKSDSFLDKWFIKHVRDEIDFVFDEIKKIKDQNTKKIITIILSRTMRSCRATTHADLATLIDPITTIYYCAKHGKICKPLFSILKWWLAYTKDTINRLKEFDKLRTGTYQICLTGDGRNLNILNEVEKRKPEFAKLIKKQKIKGIFSSPPYVGMIDYHEQHAYAYDLFKFKRNDELEIGPLCKGQGKDARDNYVDSISQVLNNCKKYLQKDYHVFLVANDKFNLYPTIAEKSGMKIINQFKRPVLNRTEKDKGAYSEIIFHLKEK
jgi:hypothetical protein